MSDIDKSSIRKILQRPISFHRIFRTITGSVTAALMLSQAYYWSDKGEDGWFWKTQDEWEEETGLSRNEQENARKLLRDKGFIVERRQGAPAKLFFHVEFDKIFTAIGGCQHSSMALTSILECDSLADKNAGNSHSLYIAETTTETTSKEPGGSLFPEEPKNKKSKVKEKPFALPEWVPVEAWGAFVDMRKRIKAPLTEYAKHLAVKDLERLIGESKASYVCWPDRAEQILNQSTAKCWRGLFEVHYSSNLGRSPEPAPRDKLAEIEKHEREQREKIARQKEEMR